MVVASVRPLGTKWSILMPAVLLLAGCTGATDPAPTPASDSCIATASDGTPLECDDWPLAPAAALAHPDVRDGWACTIDHDDDAPEEFYRLYAHADGRLGWAWRSPQPPMGIHLLSMILVEPGHTQSVLLPYQPDGFAEFSEPAQGMEGTAYIRFHRFILDELVDGEWLPIPDARLAVGIVNATGYFAWQIPTAEGPLVIDLMETGDDGLSLATSRVVDSGGRHFSAAVSNHGVSFGGQYFTVARAAGGDCWQESLPGGLA